jgi:hypothetical protein
MTMDIVVQMGCLMLATKQVLSPWIKDTRTIEKIVNAHMGDFTSPVLRCPLQMCWSLAMFHAINDEFAYRMVCM